MLQVINSRHRTSKRPKTGCSEYRRRKIKCDEEQPQCGQCLRRGRTCTLQDSQFRHVLPVRQGALRTVSGAHSNIVVRKTLGTGNSTPSIGSIIRNGAALASAENGRPTQRLAPRDHRLQGVPPIRKTSSQEQRPVLVGSEVPRALNDHDGFSSSGSFSALPTSNHDDLAIESTEVINNTQEPYLIRHDAECIGPWMDLLYRYEVFSREVLSLARDHPVLRYAACAVAAKQLGQIGNALTDISCGNTQATLGLRLARARHGITSECVRQPVSLSQGNLMIQAEREDPVVRLLATCILIQYEQLSTSRDAWSGHLTGFSKLLDLIGDGILLRPNPRFQAVYPFTKDVMQIKAGFWNFVVNGLEESCTLSL
ncbi:hypothetical protein F5Y10DRAFT_272936 [Nemania abortiva]|nr:hypothetical protein F5Y10DRAFT_272936 [Nemania abortiva]